MKSRYAAVAYKRNGTGIADDMVYEDVRKWWVRDGALILSHRGDITVIPLTSFDSCDIREEKE